MARLRTILAIAATAAAALPATAATVTVTLQNRQFNPAVVAIRPGDTIHWLHMDGAMSHDVNSDSPTEPYQSPVLVEPNSFDHVFAAAGRFPYHCNFHGTMTGTILVMTADVFVAIESFSFMPPSVVINQGQSVGWYNVDGTPHTTTSDTAVWDSGTLNQGQPFTRVFPAAGTFPYHCNFHPGMLGTVTVNGVPTISVLKAVKEGNDVVLSFTGSPTQLCKATLRVPPAAPPAPTCAAITNRDAAVVMTPPSLTYQVQ